MPHKTDVINFWRTTMGHTWHYSDVAYQEVGSMICTKCKHLIHNGEYRYRETPDAYLAQHRHCSTDDKMWQCLDKKKAESVIADVKRLGAYIKLRDKWGEEALNCEIEEMEAALHGKEK